MCARIAGRPASPGHGIIARPRLVRYALGHAAVAHAIRGVAHSVGYGLGAHVWAGGGERAQGLTLLRRPFAHRLVGEVLARSRAMV